MRSTLNKRINKSDFAYIDYSVGGSNNQSINPLNELFCDKIIVFTPIENIYLFKLNDNIERENDINHIYEELLGKTTAKIKFAFNHIGLPKNKKQIKPTSIKYIVNENYIIKTSDYIYMLKVNLDQFPSDKLIDILSNTKNLKFSSDNNIFINDIDFTQDFSGLFNKEKILLGIKASLQTYGINYDIQQDEIENIQALNKLEILLANIHSKSCKEKIDQIVNTNDKIHIIGYRSLNKGLIIKLGINDEIDDHYIIASYFLT